MAEGDGDDDKEEIAWEKLMDKAVSLRGDPEVEALLESKHKELLYCAVPLDSKTGQVPSAPDGTTEAEAREAWYRRKLRSLSGDRRERRKLCKALVKSLKKLGEKYADAKGPFAETTSCDVLKDGGPQEGPLIIARLAVGLAGTRFEGLRIAKERPGVYQLGAKLLVAVQADLEGGELLVHGYFDDNNVLHPVRSPVLAFLEEHGAKPAEDVDCDLFGGSAGAKQVDKQPAAATEESASKRARELPPGWAKRESRSQPGKFYYVHEAKGLSQFERPTA